MNTTVARITTSQHSVEPRFHRTFCDPSQNKGCKSTCVAVNVEIGQYPLGTLNGSLTDQSAKKLAHILPVFARRFALASNHSFRASEQPSHHNQTSKTVAPFPFAFSWWCIHDNLQEWNTSSKGKNNPETTYLPIFDRTHMSSTQLFWGVATTFNGADLCKCCGFSCDTGAVAKMDQLLYVSGVVQTHRFLPKSVPHHA